LFVDSVATRDYSVMMSLTMLFSILTLVGNLVADLLYGVADPRIRLD
jgi:peptide/nickel transport system permease protein